MKFFIIPILIIILCSCSINKNINKKKNKDINFTLLEITNKLNSKGLKYVALKKNCIGEYEFNEPDKNDCPHCKPHYETYIFWNEKGSFFVQKFDNCSEFNKVEITGFNFIKYIENNLNKLKSQNVKNYEVAEGTYEIVSHSCFREYWINNNKSTIYKYFDLHRLTTRNDNPNLNYESNNQLAIVVLDKKLNKIIEELNTKKKFLRNTKTCYN